MLKKLSVGRILVILIAAVVFCYSAYQFVMTFVEYRQSTEEYDELEAMIFSSNPAAASTGVKEGQNDTVQQNSSQNISQNIAQNTAQSPETESTPAGTTEAALQEAQQVYVDFATLKEMNPDAIAWITMYGTDINYPVVQGEDNDYYLHHTFNGKENSAGAIFVDAAIEEGMEARNVIVYGHNMKNGSMFGTLSYYKNEDMVRNYPAFLVYTETGTYEYAIFAAYMTTALSDTYIYGFGSDESYANYIDRMKSQSLYDTGVEVSVNDKIITLSTCSGSTEDSRFVVQAKRVEPTLTE